MERDRSTSTTGGASTWLFLALVVALVLAALVAFLLVVEMPRRARNRAVEIIEAHGGTVETVSGCPEWLRETFAEDYFQYVVAVDVSAWPRRPGEPDVLSALPHLDRLALVNLVQASPQPFENLPYSPDLYELRLQGPKFEELPRPDDVPNLASIELLSPRWRVPADARRLAEYESLEVLRLECPDPDVVREVLAVAGELPRLRELYVEGCPVGDDSLRSLSTATGLVVLDLSRTGITSAGVEHLAGLTALRHLELDNALSRRFFGTAGPRAKLENHIGDAAMPHLAGMTDLRFLKLEGTDVGDEGMRHIASLGEMRFLYLQQTLVGNAGVEQIGNLRKLERLNLDKRWQVRAVIDDAAIEHLAKLSNLEVVSLNSTDVTVAGIGRLQHALPRAEVHPRHGRHSPSRLKQRLDAAKRQRDAE